ncbi:dehydrogenase, partial [Amylostereum chailletii]
EVLVKITAAALNPTDWKTAKWSTSPGSISGCDFAGVVEALGPDVPEGLRTVGERVSTFVPGGRTPSTGAYAQYVAAKADLCLHIPDSWTLEEAAQLPIAVFTTAQCLYQSLNLPSPSSHTTEPIPLLVYGASSSVGNYVVQFASLAGLTVYALAGARNFELIKSLGAKEVYDYKDPEAAAKIKAATGGKIVYAVDCISELGSDKIISDALSDDGGKIACILPYKGTPKENITPIMSLAYDLVVDRPGSPSYLANGPTYAKLISDLLAGGKLKPSPILVMPKGLESVADGFKYMMDGKVSAQKVIFRISDTPGL